MTFADQLRKLHACDEAVEWVAERTLEQAWAECERGDWMIWLLNAIEYDDRHGIIRYEARAADAAAYAAARAAQAKIVRKHVSATQVAAMLETRP
jgi:hypothetical protein